MWKIFGEMMRKAFIIPIICSVILLQGCKFDIAKDQQTTSKPEVKQQEQAKITFEVSSFNLEYKKENTSFFEESYTGTGIITPSGDEKLVKKPYLVLLNITEDGGNGHSTSYSNGLQTVIVNNGVGKFQTYVFNTDRNINLAKPVYNFKILGYVPFSEIENNNINLKQ